MNCNGVIFDFNGTLFWDTPLHNQAWDLFLEEYRIKLSDVEKHQRLHGKNNQDILRSLFQEELTADDIQTLIQRKEGIYRAICLKQKMELAPGAVSFLDYLQEKRVECTIATASGIENLRFYFEHLNLGKWFPFDRIVYNDGMIKSKPDPEIFLKAIQKLNKSAREILIFEDSPAGITAAERAAPRNIIIVDSNHDDYRQWNYPVIRSFTEVDRNLFG